MRIIKFVPKPVQSRVSATDQDYKTLHASFEEYLVTGKLDVSSLPASFDFAKEEDVDFNKPLPHDIELLDAACGRSSAFPQQSVSSSEHPEVEKETTGTESKISETTEPSGDPEK